MEVHTTLGQSEHREAWTSVGAWPRAERSLGRCAGHGRRGPPAPVGDAWARDVTACWRPA
jgi:hypothetical protein